jgi:hypothetical protein
MRIVLSLMLAPELRHPLTPEHDVRLGLAMFQSVVLSDPPLGDEWMAARVGWTQDGCELSRRMT